MSLLHITFLSALCLLMSACGGTARNTGESGSDTAAVTTTSNRSVSFSGDSALMLVKAQCDFGPRVPNTAAHERCADFLAARLDSSGWQVTEQRADLKAFDGTVLKARNIFASLNPEASDRTLLLAHYDTRPWADEDPDPAKRSQPVMGANDGASGVAVLLEIARTLAANGSQSGVDILLVDAEDYGTDGDEDSWALGTQYFAANPPVAGYSPRRAILLDMVGHPDAVFPIEYFSAQGAPAVVREVWETAAKLGLENRFPARIGSAVNDDHLPLLKVGIPAIDIIDFRSPESALDGGSFPPGWHTTADTPDNISAKTLQDVGTLLTALLNP